jgi:hypothetical protein
MSPNDKTDLCKCDIRVVVLEIPYLLVQDSAGASLQDPTNRGQDTKDASQYVSLTKHCDRVDEACGSRG